MNFMGNGTLFTIKKNSVLFMIKKNFAISNQFALAMTQSLMDGRIFGIFNGPDLKYSWFSNAFGETQRY